MRVGVFNCNQHDIETLTSQNVDYGLEMTFFKLPLNVQTIKLAEPFDAVAISATDNVSAEVLDKLLEYNIHHVALRCAGFNHVDVSYAKKIGISISRVPNYSQSSVAEHTVALVLALSRKLCDAQHRIKVMIYEVC
jgi:D-lactate dehydrogenase